MFSVALIHEIRFTEFYTPFIDVLFALIIISRTVELAL